MSSIRHHCRHRLALSLAVMCAVASASCALRTTAIEAGTPGTVTVGHVTFRCPKYFSCEPVKRDDSTVFLRHDGFDLGVFVVAPAKIATDEELHAMAGWMAKQVYPEPAGTFRWKLVEKREKISEYEVGAAQLQGIQGDLRVSLIYRRLRVRGEDVLVGYVFRFGQGPRETVHFEQNLGGDSLPGWDATALMICSITGEDIKDVSPGATGEFPPPPKR